MIAKALPKWKQFEALMNNALDGIYIMDLNGNILEANDSFCNMLGYTHDEIIHLNISDWNSQYSKEELVARLKSKIGKNERFETIHRRKDATSLEVEISSTGTIVDGEIYFFASSRDITKRKQLDKNLRLAQFTIEWAQDAIFYINKDAQFLYVNDAACRHLGYTKEELLLLSVLDINPSFSIEVWRENWKITEGSSWHRFETQHKRKNGSNVPVEVVTNYGKLEGDGVFFSFVRDITERKKTEELLWKQAHFDSLTELPNRHMFHSWLEQEIKKSQRTNLPMALLFIDLDDFKVVNDSLGHNIGDTLLVEAAQRIKSCLREADIVARIGGDEFTIILSELQNLSKVGAIAQNILDMLIGPFQLGKERVFISASIGITIYPDDATNVNALLKNADQAMYAAKAHGRNCYHYFTVFMQDTANAKMRISNDLRGALVNQQFRVVYQPIVTLSNGAIHKAEALIRWQHPTRGQIRPTEFIPVAEGTGMIVEIGDWVFREVAHQAAHWRTSHYSKFQISLNVSPIQFRNKGTNFKAWLDYLQELGMDGQGIVMEITEGLLLDANTSVTHQLLAFRDAGIQVSLDDFGTGYSSLSYLKKFDIGYLKIDQSFVHELAMNPNDMALCEAIIVMAHKLGLKVIAEGIETEEQRSLLAAAGCDYGQGYLFSKPIPPEEFEALLSKKSI